MKRLSIVLGLVLIGAPKLTGALTIPPNTSYPTPPARMTVYRLAPSPVSATVLQATLGVAVADADSRDLSWFRPSPERTGRGDFSESMRARELFRELLPADATSFVPAAPIPLRRQRVALGESAGEIETVGSLVRMNRSVDGRRVFGVGSIAVAELRDGTVTGVLTRWEAAIPHQLRVACPLTDARLRQSFAEQFVGFDGSGTARTESVEIVYFDTREFLIPAFRILVSVARTVGAADQVAVYVPATDFELPPIEPVVEADDLVCESGAQQSGMADRYVLPDASFGGKSRQNARSFRRSLGSALSFRNFCHLASEHLNETKASYVETSRIAFVQTHGAPGMLQVSVSSLTPLLNLSSGTGYGALGLELLILHSCDVVTGAVDSATWFSSWRGVFRGLHTVVGFRTKAMLTDGVPAGIGLHLKNGDPIIRSWMMEVAGSSEYAAGSFTDTLDGRRLPDGRGAAITVCTGAETTLSQLAPQPLPDCLMNYWMADS